MRPRVRLRLIGDGPMKPALESLANDLNLSNVVFENPVTKTEIPSLAADADCFVAVLRDSPLYRYGISLNKIYDYMAAGKPVIFACGAANNPVAEADAGISIAPGDVLALSDAIDRMAKMHPDDRAKMGQAGRDYVNRQHDSRLLACNFASIMNDCV